MSTSAAALARTDLTDTLQRDTDSWGGEAGFVFDRVYNGWNWTINGNYAHSDTDQETETDPLTGFIEQTAAESDTASLEGVVFASLAKLPAGDLVSTLKTGMGTEQLSSSSDRNGNVTKPSSRAMRSMRKSISMCLCWTMKSMAAHWGLCRSMPMPAWTISLMPARCRPMEAG